MGCWATEKSSPFLYASNEMKTSTLAFIKTENCIQNKVCGIADGMSHGYEVGLPVDPPRHALRRRHSTEGRMWWWPSCHGTGRLAWYTERGAC